MKKMITTTLLAALMLTACAGDGADVDESIDDATAAGVDAAVEATDTTLSDDSAEAVAKLQTSLNVLTAQFDESAVAPEIETAWAEIQARVTDAAIAVQLDPDFDTSELESAVESFDEQLDTVDTDPVLEDAWIEFRSALDAFIDSF
jgi:hypothetical protein